MPASFFIVPAVVIGVIAWAVAWWYTRKRARFSRRDEIRRLRNHALWLEQRLDLARQEKWDPAMIISLSAQLGTACEELATAQRGSRRDPQSARSGASYSP